MLPSTWIESVSKTTKYKLIWPQKLNSYSVISYNNVGNGYVQYIHSVTEVPMNVQHSIWLPPSHILRVLDVWFVRNSNMTESNPSQCPIHTSRRRGFLQPLRHWTQLVDTAVREVLHFTYTSHQSCDNSTHSNSFSVFPRQLIAQSVWASGTTHDLAPHSRNRLCID